MQRPTLLLVEENPTVRERLKERLCRYGFCVIESQVRAITLEYVRKKDIDVLILGATRENSGEALELAYQVREYDSTLPLILVTSESSEELAVRAIRAGINDYFKSPVGVEELAASIKRRLVVPRAAASNGSGLLIGRIIGDGQAMQHVKTYISRLAPTGSNVLLTGETGTGKELVAELIHKNSPRVRKPFVCINCAAIPDTLIESEFFGYEKGAFTGALVTKHGKLRLADGGTVFFDEIGDMTPYAQAKILRTIESKEIQPLGGLRGVAVDFRVVAATNHDLERMTGEGKFRQDLYFRLNVGRIHLPPLRERKEDIPTLIQYYIAEFNRHFRRAVEGFSEEALAYLLRYDWPGNVRELKNLLEATFVNLPAGAASVIDLPEQFRNRLNAVQSLVQNERQHLLSTLLLTSWNKSKTAEKLNWSRMTLYRKLAKYQIPRNPNKKGSEGETSEKSVTSSDAA